MKIINIFQLWKTMWVANNMINYQLVYNNLFPSIPCLRVHDIVILESTQTKERIGIDFIPILHNLNSNNYTYSTYSNTYSNNNNNYTATLNMLIGKNINGKIRVCSIPKTIDIHNTTFFKTYDLLPHIEVKYFNNKIKSKLLRCFCKQSFQKTSSINNQKYNLYKYNCKHFSYQLKQQYIEYLETL